MINRLSIWIQRKRRNGFQIKHPVQSIYNWWTHCIFFSIPFYMFSLINLIEHEEDNQKANAVTHRNEKWSPCHQNSSSYTEACQSTRHQPIVFSSFFSFFFIKCALKVCPNQSDWIRRQLRMIQHLSLTIIWVSIAN